MAKTIHNLKLHETLIEEKNRITRVAGGWIYEVGQKADETYNNAVFVPYKREFNVLFPISSGNGFKLSELFKFS